MNMLGEFMWDIYEACKKLGITDRGTLPIGGKYPVEYFAVCRSHKRNFYAIIHRGIQANTQEVSVVEQLTRPDNDKGRYRLVTKRILIFLYGTVETPQENGREYGLSLDGYQIRLLDLDDEIKSYMNNFPPDEIKVGSKKFSNARKALEYYAAWETKEQCLSRLKAFKKYIMKKE